MREVLAVVMLVAVGGCGSVAGGGQPDAPVGTDGGGGDGATIDGGTIDGPPAMATSCTGLPSNCGSSGSASCCESPLVTGGTYSRSYDVATDGMYPNMSFGATVSNFRLDKYEVTVGRFRQFVNAGRGTQANPPAADAGAHPNLAGSGWVSTWNANLVTTTSALIAGVNCQATYQTWTDTPGANELRPMVCMTWYEAMAFCAWDGGFVATEAEWNYAASGGSSHRAYPWSVPAGALVINDTHASWNCTGDGLLGCTAADLVAVGTNPAGDARFGQSDLAGNVYEWTLDWYRSPYVTPCVDCAELTPGMTKVIRGATWGDAEFNMRAGHRGSVRPPIVRESGLGIRCARTP